MDFNQTRHVDAARNRGWKTVSLLVDLLVVLLAGLTDISSRDLKTRAFRLLRPAEAIARRLLLLIAVDLPVPSAPCHTTFTRDLAGFPEGQPARFRLTEALHANFSAMFRDEVAPSFPAFSTVAGASPLIADGPCDLISVKLRLEALKNVLDAPALHARRMARRMRSARKGRRISPIRTTCAPASQSPYISGDVRSMLRHLNHLARIAPWPP